MSLPLGATRDRCMARRSGARDQGDGGPNDAGGRLGSPAGAPHEAGAWESADEDRRLVRGAVAGDARSFEGLVEKYRHRSIAIAQNIVLDAESARDVAQEALLKLYRSLHRYDPEQRFYTWFYRMVVHLAIDHLRRARHWPRRLGEWDEETGGARITGPDREPESAGARLEREERKGRVHRVLAALPEKYRVLLVLRDMEGFTSKEIAEIARSNHATVRWRLHRAREMFRGAWRAAGFPEEGEGGA